MNSFYWVCLEGLTSPNTFHVRGFLKLEATSAARVPGLPSWSAHLLGPLGVQHRIERMKAEIGTDEAMASGFFFNQDRLNMVEQPYTKAHPICTTTGSDMVSQPLLEVRKGSDRTGG